MDKQGFVDYLKSRGIDDDSIGRQVAVVADFAEHLGRVTPPATLESATGNHARGFIRLLIDTGRNSDENLAALARYGYFCKNMVLYAAVLELLDGAEAMDGLHRRLAEVLGEGRRDELFAGVELPPLGLPNEEKALLMQKMVTQMEEELDQQTMKQILSPCLRDLDEGWFAADKLKYEELENIDEFLAWKRERFIEQLENCRDNGVPFFGQMITTNVIEHVKLDREISQGIRRGSVLYVVKIPYLAQEFLVILPLSFIQKSQYIPFGLSI